MVGLLERLENIDDLISVATLMDQGDRNELISAVAIALGVLNYYEKRRNTRKEFEQGVLKSIESEVASIVSRYDNLNQSTAEFLWIGERAFLGLAAASRIIREHGDEKSQIAKLVLRKRKMLLRMRFLQTCKNEIRSPGQSPIKKFRYLWPLVEFLEEAIDLYLVETKDKILFEILEVLLPLEKDEGLDYDCVWAIARACQEIQERSPLDQKKMRVVQLIKKRIDKKDDPAARAILNYCLRAEQFEEIEHGTTRDSVDIVLEDLIIEMLKLPRSLYEEPARLHCVRCLLEGSLLFQSGSTESINEWIDKAMEECVETTPRWTAVSFLRLGLQLLPPPKLEQVAVHLLEKINIGDWPVFPLVEIFEPKFFDLVFLRETNGVKVRTNSFVSRLKILLALGASDDCDSERLIELVYGVATCLAELSEKGKFPDKRDVIDLFDKHLLSDVPESSARRRLLKTWLECRVDTYPRMLNLKAS